MMGSSMQMMVIEHLNKQFEMYRELSASLPEDAFARSLAEPSNTIGEQLWCVIGARESYLKGILNDGWIDFGCSLHFSKTKEKQAVMDALANSAGLFSRLADDLVWTEVREQLLLDLLEHEVQHQGQLIRYVYGLGYRFPDSWAERWALDQ